MESPTCSMSGSSPSSGCRNSSIIRQCHNNIGSACKHGKRTAAVFPEREEELEIERWTDDESEFMWLSSDGKSSSFKFIDDESWDSFSIDLQDLFSAKNHGLFQGNRISAFLNESMAYPIEGTFKDVLNEEHLLAWLLNLKESSSTCSESIGLSLENPLNENLSVVLPSDFPSSSIKSTDCLDIPIGIPNTAIEDSTSSMSTPEVANLDEFDTNGPLFWPFEHKFGSTSSESSWDFFVMSPLKSGRKAVNDEGFITPNKPLMLRLHESRKHKEKGLLSPPTRKAVDWTDKELKNLRRTNTMPSRLSKSSQHCIKERPIEFKDVVGLLKEPKLSEVDCLISEEMSIETLIGLEEFDGHEGVDADLNEDCFLLDEFLEDKTNTI